MSNARGAPLLLNGSNYPAWSFLMKAKIDKMGALDIVQGIVPGPVNTEEFPAKPEELAKPARKAGRLPARRVGNDLLGEQVLTYLSRS
ncbi:hypothetical protein PCASD_16174 [Puccinia coronata f. sp. avenae]|uniref:DUF4219 domain-containing protein n=1 Tax=Puccinia coronata f. sp. avenae TaxID=200324 RepID=A0A2N5UBE9_9BASI|nr:hypothetical protein PCASD_16174 [Puccinia coronata f. sp. avenae]